jgi:hypothetical protein
MHRSVIPFLVLRYFTAPPGQSPGPRLRPTCTLAALPPPGPPARGLNLET